MLTFKESVHDRVLKFMKISFMNILLVSSIVFYIFNLPPVKADQDFKITNDLKNDILHNRLDYKLLNLKKYEIYTKSDHIPGGLDVYKKQFESNFPNLTELAALDKEIGLNDVKTGHGFITIYYEDEETIGRNNNHLAAIKLPSVFSATELGTRTANGDNDKYNQEYYHKPIFKSICSSFYITIEDTSSVDHVSSKAASFFITENNDFYSCLNRLFVNFLGLRYSATAADFDLKDVIKKIMEIKSLKLSTEVSR